MGFSGTIIDVRTEDEFSRDGNPDFINIPLNEIEERIDEFKEMKKPIILCCRSGGRSEIAIELLKKYEIDDIYNGEVCKNIK